MKYILLLPLLLLHFSYSSTASAQEVYEVENAFPGVYVANIVVLTAPEDSPYVYLTSQNGQLYRVDTRESTPSATLWLDISGRIVSGGERGLLGLAFHPNFSENGEFYTYYTAPTPLRSVISRFTVTDIENPEASTTLGDPTSEEILLQFNQPFTNHNGGHIAFGPDGFLYIASGDGGSGGDPQNNAQNANNLLGAMLRIDVNTQSGYAIPSDNPWFVGENGADELYAIGLRNPWRFSFDRETGVLWTADVGQNAWEAIHIIEKGKNYGWKIIEGSNCFPIGTTCSTAGLELPIFEYNHDNGDRSVTGGYVYRGVRNPELRGKYIYGDFISGRVWALDFNSDTYAVNSNVELVNNPFNISSFGEDSQGELYILSYGSGLVYRFVDTTSGPDPSEVPARFTIHSAYPNPFNPKTNISFDVTQVETVSLDLFRADGVHIMQIAQNTYSPGRHSVTLDASNLSSGMYFVRATSSSNITQTIKVSLIK